MSEIKYLDLAGLTEFKEELDRVRQSDNLNITEALNDISGSIGNGTLTIKKNNVSQGTFTANLKTNSEINVSVPTNITDLGLTAITEIQNLIRYGQLDVSSLTNELKLALHESIASTYDYLSEADVEDKLEAYGKIIHYDSSTLKIQLKNGNTVLSEFSAADFISDGMVEDVRITSGTGDNVGKTVLLIDFNTDSGITDIEIPLEDIFDASNYYTKTEVDNLLPDTLTQSEVNTGTDTTGKLVSAKIIKDSIDNAIYGGGGSSGTVITTTNLSTEGIAAGFAKTVQVGTATPIGIDSNGNIPIPAYPTTLPASDVSSWAKQSTKPSYDLDEVIDGTTRKIPTKVSDLTNDSGFTTNEGTVTGIKIGTAETLSPTSGVITLPEYPEQLQSDWEQSTTTAKDYIKNKPTIITNQAILDLFGGSSIDPSENANVVTTNDVVSTTKNGVVPKTTAAVKYLQTDSQGVASWGDLPTDTDTKYKLSVNGTLNGDSTGTDLGSIYAPSTAGTTGQYLKSAGSGAPVWENFPASLPASDVQSWAKAANKPSYGYGEITYLSNTTSDYTINNSSTTLSVDGTQPLQVVTTTTNIAGVTFSALPADGHSCHLIITATSAKTVNIAHDATMITVGSTAYKTVCPKAAAMDTLNITANGYVELDLLRVGTKIYVRGV